MPSLQTATQKTGLVIDRRTHTIKLTRNFDAPRAEIFEALIRTCRLLWIPPGSRSRPARSSCGLAGPSNSSRRTIQTCPSGTYREIAPPSRLIFEALGATGRVILEEAHGGTNMAVEIECRSAEHLDEFLKMGIDVGTAQTLDNLVARFNNFERI